MNNNFFNNILAHGHDYFCLILFVLLFFRQVRFEQACHKVFIEIKEELAALKVAINQIDARVHQIEATMLRFQEQMIQVKGTLKDIENQFKINDIKHESYEERLRKLEAERADYLRSKQI